MSDSENPRHGGLGTFLFQLLGRLRLLHPLHYFRPPVQSDLAETYLPYELGLTPKAHIPLLAERSSRTLIDGRTNCRNVMPITSKA